MFKILILVVLAALVFRMAIRLIGQIVNQEGWPRIGPTLTWLVVPFVLATYLLFFPLNPFPVHRFSNKMLDRLHAGMTRGEVEAVLGCPAGHYGNPEFSEFWGNHITTSEKNPNTWSDDRVHLEMVFFDDSRHQFLTAIHLTRSTRRYASPLLNWIRQLRQRWFPVFENCARPPSQRGQVHFTRC